MPNAENTTSKNLFKVKDIFDIPLFTGTDSFLLFIEVYCIMEFSMFVYARTHNFINYKRRFSKLLHQDAYFLNLKFAKQSAKSGK